MQLTNGYGQVIKPDWLKGDLTLEKLCANIGGLQRLEMSRNVARKLHGSIPRCGYEVVSLVQTVHEGHTRTLWLTNVSDAKY